MNNFHYQKNLITTRNASIMGGKTYLPKLRDHSGGEVQKFREPPCGRIKEVYRTQAPYGTGKSQEPNILGNQEVLFFSTSRLIGVCLPTAKQNR
ncbi:MAG TPA: hypothetical protein EYM28_07650 [Rhodospirillales bacterium]|nr:hypothetical protein [Rhodospirillales bacterium]